MSGVMTLVNGTPSHSVGALDRGLHYGDGVFETVVIEDGGPLCLERHMQRLSEGCERLGIGFPFRDELTTEIHRLAHGRIHGICKIILTRAGGQRGYRPPRAGAANRVVILYPEPDSPRPRPEARVKILKTRLGRNPDLAGIKHLNRLEQVLAQSELAESGLDEGLMLDSGDLVVEGTMTNLFGVRGGILFTPDLSRCGVAGIVRAQVLELAEPVTGAACTITDITREGLLACDEVFLCNSAREIWPVAEIDGQALRQGPVAQRLGTEIHAVRRGGAAASP